MKQTSREQIEEALGRIPTGVFVLTAEHEDRRGGMVIHWVQRVCREPPMVCVAVAKGESIMPLLSESRAFGLCQLAEEDRLTTRRFASMSESVEDPFLGFELSKVEGHRVPVLAHSLMYLECELVCHMDVEGDHDLFVGRVKAAGCGDGRPQIRVNDEPSPSHSRGSTG